MLWHTEAAEAFPEAESMTAKASVITSWVTLKGIGADPVIKK